MPDAYPAVWRFCISLTGRRDWGEDVLQATCLRAIEKADGFEPGTHLDHWMMRIAHRLWLNELRARKVRTGGGLVPVEDIDVADQKTPDAETNIFVSEVLSKINTLPDAQRHAVSLVYVEGMSYREAADIMEIPIGTVMSRLAAARKTLNQSMPDQKRSSQ
ncbi:RNA polymerase sigma factor [Roseobacter sp.]|uniref:RNA polymerase sigma factor n=1 Tax=Roseobacter sp. TaxID=1907202 RepID=UPI00296714C3|nr:RNA polymerase sigma factor [Roseobacter sp.]MDW3182840.1 RNA polymerase sigma factor [Roseobacter sp.]